MLCAVTMGASGMTAKEEGVHTWYDISDSWEVVQIARGISVVRDGMWKRNIKKEAEIRNHI